MNVELFVLSSVTSVLCCLHVSLYSIISIAAYEVVHFLQRNIIIYHNYNLFFTNIENLHMGFLNSERTCWKGIFEANIFGHR